MSISYNKIKEQIEKIAKIKSPIEREQWVKALAKNVHVSSKVIKLELQDFKKQLPADINIEKNKNYPEKIDTSQFKSLSSQDIINVLGLTIKQDENNKLVTFLCELSAYTDNAQFNISFNAPSSTGKSFIPTEIVSLFPQEDIMELGYCSPTAFFHDTGEWNEETKILTVDLSRKVLIFLDQPHNELLARLRPLLSHDKKQISMNPLHGLKPVVSGRWHNLVIPASVGPVYTS